MQRVKSTDMHFFSIVEEPPYYFGFFGTEIPEGGPLMESANVISGIFRPGAVLGIRRDGGKGKIAIISTGDPRGRG